MHEFNERNCDSSSISTICRFLHEAKTENPNFLTFLGIEKLIKAESENAKSSINCNDESS